MVSSKRILNSFTTAAKAQADSLRCVVDEAERYARDCALLAAQELRTTAKAQGVNFSDEQMASAVGTVFNEKVSPRRVCSLICQARTRQETRVKHKDPFATVDKTLNTLRGTANGRED